MDVSDRKGKDVKTMRGCIQLPPPKTNVLNLKIPPNGRRETSYKFQQWVTFHCELWLPRSKGRIWTPCFLAREIKDQATRKESNGDLGPKFNGGPVVATQVCFGIFTFFFLGKWSNLTTVICSDGLWFNHKLAWLFFPGNLAKNPSKTRVPDGLIDPDRCKGVRLVINSK